jgi:hypothetical protein
MKWRWIGAGIGAILAFFTFLSVSPAQASPFGQGVFGANVPFGSATSLSINVGSDVTIPLTLNTGTFSGTGSHTVTVTSTDVVGYYLYVHTTSTTGMVNANGATIPASANGSPAALATNTWGYNTTGSTTNFLGMGLTSSVIKDASGPFTSGDSTTVTYGALTDTTQDAGSYSVAVTYTAVAKDQ